MPSAQRTKASRRASSGPSGHEASGPSGYSISRPSGHEASGPSDHQTQQILVVHPLPPVVDEGSRVLLLGTMPSPKSRQAGFHYGNPHNRFWRVIAALWGEELPTDIPARRDLCRRHHLALDDVLASCRITGASDASIRDPVPNDLRRLCAYAPIERIFCTGGTATKLYRRLIEPDFGMPCIQLPSTSPANARMSLSDLITAYAPVREAVDQTMRH